MARILFSSISNGTGLPDDSISFHRPVTPIILMVWCGVNKLKEMGNIKSCRAISQQKVNKTSESKQSGKRIENSRLDDITQNSIIVHRPDIILIPVN